MENRLSPTCWKEGERNQETKRVVEGGWWSSTPTPARGEEREKSTSPKPQIYTPPSLPTLVKEEERKHIDTMGHREQKELGKLGEQGVEEHIEKLRELGEQTTRVVGER